MKNEVERLLKGRGLEIKSDKNLTENLRQWRADRNITKADYFTFVENILEELMECIHSKDMIPKLKKQIMNDYFNKDIVTVINSEVVDILQDIQVFCINETELMGYDNIKCNSEVFKHINCRKQDPTQKEEWLKNGAVGKWQKDKNQPKDEIYEPNYESCKL